MEKTPVVKARAHYGSKSLDITIPVSICKEFDISEGDVFSVKVDKNGERIKLIYSRIYQQ